MKVTKSFVTLLVLTAILTSCNDQDPWEFIPPDFSSVPERYDISGTEPVEIDEHVIAYIIDESDNNFFVSIRDIVTVHITLRTDEGDIIYSSFANGADTPVQLEVNSLHTISGYIGRPFYDRTLLNSPGFKKGILGMRERESRTLIVEPEEGFLNGPATLPNEEYRNSTLIYDIHVSRIDPS